MTERNPFVISRGFKNYFIFSLLFTLIEQTCIVIDMVLVGNFVSAEAFSALNLVVPVEGIVTGIIMLFTGGASIIASHRIGDQDFHGANRSLSLALVSTVAVMASASVIGLLATDRFVDLLCPDPALSDELSEYLTIYFTSFIPLSLYSATILLLNVDGKPDIILWTVLAASVLDIALDVVFMKYMNMGVRGVALAGLASYTLPLFFMIPYISSSKCKFRFELTNGSRIRSDFAENLGTGIPYCMPYVALSLITFLVNTLVLTRLGPDALYVWGAGYQILSIIIVAMGCIGGTILVIMGGMLAGNHDMAGFAILARWCFKTAATIVGMIVVAVLIFPEWTLSIFGYDKLEGNGLVSIWVRCIVLLGIPYTICGIKVYVSQALGRKWLSIVPLAIFFLLTVGGMFLCSRWYPEMIFPSLIISGIAIILIDFVACVLLRKKRLPKVSRYLLIPGQNEEKSRCISVQYTRESLNSALKELEQYLDGMEVSPATMVGINLCCEELMLSIVDNNAGKSLGDDWFFDVFLREEDGDVKITIKDAGKPFNPVKMYRNNSSSNQNGNESAELSLRIVNNICKELSYNYMYGQNTIFMAFQK